MVTARATAAAMELATVAAVVAAQEATMAVVAAVAMDSEAVGWAEGRVAAMVERAAVRTVERSREMLHLLLLLRRQRIIERQTHSRRAMREGCAAA